jgi:hypothetical protein
MYWNAHTGIAKGQNNKGFKLKCFSVVGTSLFFAVLVLGCDCNRQYGGIVVEQDQLQVKKLIQTRKAIQTSTVDVSHKKETGIATR